MAKRQAPITVETEVITADSSAFDIARKKAVHGHKTWLVYRRKDGSHVARIYTAAAIKAALLASGTRGKFWWMAANSGHSNMCRSWSYGIHLWRCARGAERHGFSAA